MSQPMHHVYFVHGMGRHSENWVDEPIDSDGGSSLRDELKTIWSQYNKKGFLGGFDSKIDLVSISYDHVFKKLYSTWKEEVNKLRTHISTDGRAIEELDSLLKIAEAPADGEVDDKFFYTHALDVLWYYFSPSVEQKIVAEVADQILTSVKEHYLKPGHSFSVVGYSLGSSVLNRALQRMWATTDYDGWLGDGQSLSSVLKFRFFMQISNTSYVLSADPNSHYETAVRPSYYANRGVSNSMVSVSHIYDFISEIRPFDPPLEEWLDHKTLPRKRFSNLKLQRVTGPNVHSISHYLKNPRVHIPLIEGVLECTIPVDEKERGMQNYFQNSPAEGFRSLKKQWASLADLEFQSIGNFVQLLKQFYGLIAGDNQG